VAVAAGIGTVLVEVEQVHFGRAHLQDYLALKLLLLEVVGQKLLLPFQEIPVAILFSVV
jgi:hypothetical protein